MPSVEREMVQWAEEPALERVKGTRGEMEEKHH